MSNFTACALTAAVIILVLCTDLLPWKIVSRSELDDLQNQLVEARATAAKATVRQTGAWMWDSANKNLLEKPGAPGRH